MRRSVSIARRVWCSVAASLLVGCYAGLGEDEAGDDGQAEACADAEVQDPGSTALRRLSSTQYNNTVADLFAGLDIPPQTIVVDPTSSGFENFGALQTPSALLVEQYQRAAVAVSKAAFDRAGAFLPCSLDGGADPEGCGHDFIRALATRAFRRPLQDGEIDVYLSFFDAQRSEHNFRVALELTTQAILQAPEFIYFLEFDGTDVDAQADVVQLDGYAIASRLSYFLWDSMPDQALFDAAAAGELDTVEGVRLHAERMLEGTAARRSVVNFHRQWLDLGEIEEIERDPATYPEFDSALRADFREGIERDIEHVVFDGEGTLEALFSSPAAWVNDRLAPLYGVPAPGDWTRVELDPRRRAGLLTNAGWLAANAHMIHPSPVQRGVFVLERLLCQPPPPPPADVDTMPPTDSAQTPLTNRERYRQHSEDTRCVGCHNMIDNIGFTFEHYDALGRWRDQDGGQPVDATGTLASGTELDGDYDGAVELVTALAGSRTVHDCVTTHWLRYSIGRNLEETDECIESRLQSEFVDNGGDLRALLVSIVTSDAFRYRRKEATP